MELLIVAILIGLIPAAIAQSKGKSFVAWWLHGAVLFIVALPHSLLIKAEVKEIEREQLQSGRSWKCPFCAEIIKSEAIVCRYCGRDIPKEAQLVNEETPTQEVVLGVPCPKCGFRNDAAWKFCGSCSEPLTSKTTSPDLAVQIEHVAELYSKGLLSEEEFRRAKAKLLG